MSSTWGDVKRRYSWNLRVKFGPKYKVIIGHTIWDNGVGHLLDLEETTGWSTAVAKANQADTIIRIQDWHQSQRHAFGWHVHDRGPYIVRSLVRSLW